MARILVVDDDQNIQALLSATLQENGHEVTCVGDGEKALDVAVTQIPDLIVTDMSLPVKTGWEVISELKSSDETENIPIIALSAYKSQGDRDAGHEAGCDAYVAKPIDMKVLMKNVNALLG